MAQQVLRVQVVLVAQVVHRVLQAQVVIVAGQVLVVKAEQVVIADGLVHQVCRAQAQAVGQEQVELADIVV